MYQVTFGPVASTHPAVMELLEDIADSALSETCYAVLLLDQFMEKHSGG